jgi:thioredoxin reductase
MKISNLPAKETAMISQSLPVAVIGGGPIGLAAAAHLIRSGETPLVLEAGNKVARAVREWRHVSMFSPWEFNLDKAAVELLDASGWTQPAMDEIPTGKELVERYLEPLASLPALRPHILLNARVMAVTRKGYDKVRTAGRTDQPFVLRVERTGGRLQIFEAKAVIDASGTWNSPNPAGADGLAALGETAAADRVFYGIPDVFGEYRERYAGKMTMVVGGGHSALNALIELAELTHDYPATRVVWVMRKQNIEAAFGGEGADALPARGALGIQARELVNSGIVQVMSPLRIARVDRDDSGLLVVVGDHDGVEERLTIDEMVVATGFRPDFSFLREVRLSLDPWLECSGTIGPLIDPNLHSCGTVRPHGAKELEHAEPSFYIAGMKSYGRAPTFLLTTGHEQVRSIVAALTGDLESASRVELKLPETGVCKSRPIPPKGARHNDGVLVEASSCRIPSTPLRLVTAPVPHVKPCGCGS